MSSNVIVFPKGKKGSPPQSIEELLESVEMTRREHAEFIIDDVMQFAFGRSFDEGFDLAHEDFIKTTALLIESLRAALYKTVGITHPLHDVADNIFIHEHEAAAIVQQAVDETAE